MSSKLAVILKSSVKGLRKRQNSRLVFEDHPKEEAELGLWEPPKT